MMVTQDSNVYAQSIIDFLERAPLNIKNSLLIFKGFQFDHYLELSKNGIPHISSEWGNNLSDEYFNVEQILKRFLTSTTSSWALYEEFIILTNTLNDLSMFENRLLIVENNIYDKFYPIMKWDSLDNQTIIKVLEDENYQSTIGWMRNVYSDYKLENETIFISYINRHFEIDTKIEIPVVGLYPRSELVTNESLDLESVELSSLPNVCYQLEIGQLQHKKYLLHDDGSSSMRERIQYINSLGKYYDVSLFSNPSLHRKNLKEDKPLKILKKYWGDAAQFKKGRFYENPAISTRVVDISQGHIVSDVILQSENALTTKDSKYSDIIVTAPTGAGKSLFFQIPAIYLHEKFNAITLVISPLVALMIDQVNELEERCVRIGTYLNSSITFEERQSRIERIRAGEFSLIYLAPELLLSYDVRTLIGDRTIGLLVVDEAHLVTTWGRDFRVDYWFLGDHIEKIRKGNYKNKLDARPFPVLCLTATAVFGGNDDVVGDLQNSLHLACYSDHLYIGYVRRDNIVFEIRHPTKIKHSDKEEKVRLAADAIHNFISKNQKTIIYFPYRSQIEDVILHIQNSEYSKDLKLIEKYYSGNMSSIEKNEAYIKFRTNESLVMLATKAFGMGVNIHDIENVYHYAPTGTLSDYVQEVGRAARQLPSGKAITDYLKSDMHYARTLWGLSGLRHYQIQAIMRKLYSLFEENRRRNLLFTPDTFGYLFDDSEVDTKVKSGLMLLSTDLLDKYHFNVLSVRPKNLFTKQFIIVPFAIEKKFLADYGKYCSKVRDCFPLTMKDYAKKGQVEETRIIKSGDVFEIDLSELWQSKFENSTFAKFKYDFFSGNLFSYGKKKIVPNVRLSIRYENSYSDVKVNFSKLTIALQDTFNDIKRTYGGKNFKFSSFVEIFLSHYNKKIRKEYIQMLLDLFCFNSVDFTYTPPEEWKFVVRKKSSEDSALASNEYAIRGNKVGYVASNLQRYLSVAEPNLDSKTHVVYLGLPQNIDGQSFHQLLASMLQLFDMASYEISGGKNPAIFVRINDPLKLRRLIDSEKDYRNNVLTGIEARHKRSINIMNHFMKESFDNEIRWGVIEDYFLGKDMLVDQKLGILKDV